MKSRICKGIGDFGLGDEGFLRFGFVTSVVALPCGSVAGAIGCGTIVLLVVFTDVTVPVVRAQPTVLDNQLDHFARL